MERLTYDEDMAFTLADDAATIARIVRTVPAERLRATMLDAWTALEVIGHLADTSEIFATRVARCLAEDRPLLESFDQDALASERRNNERAPLELSRRLSAAHSRIVQMLQQADAPARPALHGDWGQIDAGHLGAYHARHSREHTGALARLFPPLG
jgi:hypothetical protein